MPTTTAVLGLLITAVIIWYLAEWRHCQEQRQSMNLVPNPPVASFRNVRCGMTSGGEERTSHRLTLCQGSVPE